MHPGRTANGRPIITENSKEFFEALDLEAQDLTPFAQDENRAELRHRLSGKPRTGADSETMQTAEGTERVQRVENPDEVRNEEGILPENSDRSSCCESCVCFVRNQKDGKVRWETNRCLAGRTLSHPPRISVSSQSKRTLDGLTESQTIQKSLGTKKND
jgi:hypothetical protein